MLFICSFSKGQQILLKDKIHFNIDDNTFSYPDTSFNLPVENLFNVLKDSLKTIKGKKIKNLMHIIKKYDDAIDKYNILLKKLAENARENKFGTVTLKFNNDVLLKSAFFHEDRVLNASGMHLMPFLF